MKKGLIAYLAGVLMLTTALTGCASTTEVTDDDLLNEGFHETATISDCNIIVDDNGEQILHRGNITYYEFGTGKYATSVDVNKLAFDCGKNLITNATYRLSKQMPAEEDYDHICEDCFGVN